MATKQERGVYLIDLMQKAGVDVHNSGSVLDWVLDNFSEVDETKVAAYLTTHNTEQTRLADIANKKKELEKLGVTVTVVDPLK